MLQLCRKKLAEVAWVWIWNGINGILYKYNYSSNLKLKYILICIDLNEVSVDFDC